MYKTCPLLCLCLFPFSSRWPVWNIVSSRRQSPSTPLTAAALIFLCVCQLLLHSHRTRVFSFFFF